MAQRNSAGKTVKMANPGRGRTTARIRHTNPSAIALLNHSGRKPASRGGVMAKAKRKRPMPAGLKRYWAAQKRKKNGGTARAHSKSRAGGHYKARSRTKPRANPHKARYTKRRRRNPDTLRGLPTTIFWLGAGAVGTRFTMSKLPWKIPIGGVWGTWATEVAVAIIAPKLLHRFLPGFVNQNAAALMMYGGLGSAGADAFDILKNKMPGLFQSVAVPAPQAPGRAALVPGGADQWAAGTTPAATPAGVSDLLAVQRRLVNPMGAPGFSGLRGMGDMVLWRAR